MEKENVNFIDIYVLETLNEIKDVVKRNIKLDEEKVKEIDNKMSKVLKDLINSNFKNLQIDTKGNLIYTFLPIVDEKENEKVRLSLVLYYTALYYDNVNLLHNLLKNNVNFKYNYSIMLQYLDKSLSSKFETEKYCKMISVCGYMFKYFMDSIQDLSECEKEKYIERFVYLINEKFDLIHEITLSKTYGDKFEYLFTKNKLDIFTNKTYEMANEEQLRLINSLSCFDKLNKETSNRLNNLMQTKNFSKKLNNFNLMMQLFTDEELEKIDYQISSAINNFSKTEESTRKIIEFTTRRPDLVNAIVFCSYEKFMKYDNFILEEMGDRYMLFSSSDNEIELLINILKAKSFFKKIFNKYNSNDLNKTKKLIKKK